MTAYDEWLPNLPQLHSTSCDGELYLGKDGDVYSNCQTCQYYATYPPSDVPQDRIARMGWFDHSTVYRRADELRQSVAGEPEYDDWVDDLDDVRPQRLPQLVRDRINRQIREEEFSDEDGRLRGNHKVQVGKNAR